MEIVLFAVLLGVWAALVVPSVIRSRKENAVATRAPDSPTAARRAAAEHRARVLARRRNALVVLGLAVVGTLAAAIVTGSWPILVVSLIVDVALAAYVAILLQIKQSKGSDAPHGVFDGPDEDIQATQG